MHGFNQWKGGGYGMGFGRGRGQGNGMGYGFGHGGGFGRGGRFGFGMNGFAGELPVMDELETLKRYKERLELHQRDLESEINAVEKRIAELQK